MNGLRPDRTGLDQRVENAGEGFSRAVKEYQLSNEELAGHPVYAEVCANLPRVVEIADQLARDVELVIQEDLKLRKSVFRLLKQEQRQTYAETTEERTAQLRTRLTNYNMTIVALHHWQDGDDLAAARRYIQRAYFTLFPEHFPQPAQTYGAFTLTCRDLSADVTPFDFSHHPTREAAVEYAQVLAQARQATLGAWDTYIWPDGREILRTGDDQDMMYRIAPNWHHDATTELN